MFVSFSQESRTCIIKIIMKKHLIRQVNIFVVLSKGSYAITSEKEQDVFWKECLLDLMMSTFHTNVR